MWSFNPNNYYEDKAYRADQLLHSKKQRLVDACNQLQHFQQLPKLTQISIVTTIVAVMSIFVISLLVLG